MEQVFADSFIKIHSGNKMAIITKMVINKEPELLITWDETMKINNSPIVPHFKTINELHLFK